MKTHDRLLRPHHGSGHLNRAISICGSDFASVVALTSLDIRDRIRSTPSRFRVTMLLRDPRNHLLTVYCSGLRFNDDGWRREWGSSPNGSSRHVLQPSWSMCHRSLALRPAARGAGDRDGDAAENARRPHVWYTSLDRRIVATWSNITSGWLRVHADKTSYVVHQPFEDRAVPHPTEEARPPFLVLTGTVDATSTK